MQINKTYCPKTKSKYTNNSVRTEDLTKNKWIIYSININKKACEIYAGLAHLKIVVGTAEVLIYVNLICYAIFSINCLEHML